MKKTNSIDIDDLNDFMFAEYLLKQEMTLTNYLMEG